MNFWVFRGIIQKKSTGLNGEKFQGCTNEFLSGQPLGNNDGFIFRYWKLRQQIESQANQLLGELGEDIGDETRYPLHLIGDAAFTLPEYLMKPFPSVKTEQESLFNYRLSRARRVNNFIDLIIYI